MTSDCSPEIWKPVVGFEGCYEVSSRGRVKSLPRVVRLNYRPRKLVERILRPGLASSGYRTVALASLTREKRSCCIHRLVAEAFIDNPHGLPEVNHKDGDKANCYVGNLEWCTTSQNVQHAYDTGLLDPSKRRNRANPKKEAYL